MEQVRERLKIIIPITLAILIPVYYTLYKRWQQWRESRREQSG